MTVSPNSKGIVRALEAVHAGAGTSEEVSEMTGLGLKTASAYLSDLTAAGCIRETGTTKPSKRRGHAFHVYTVC